MPSVAQVSVIFNDTFSLKSNKASVNEGDSVTITLTTIGIANGTQVPYTISGIQDADITQSRTGNFTVTDNTATVDLNIVQDFITDDSETLKLSLTNNTSVFVDVSIINTSSEIYLLSADKTFVNEGDSFTVALSTRGVLNDVQVPYTITGITSNDISGVPLIDNFFTINNNLATSTFNVSADFVSEGTETFTLTLTNGLCSQDVSIVDSSVETYVLSANKTSVDEGDSFTIALSTRGVLDAVEVPYTISGITSNDISGALLLSAFSINNNLATSTFNVSADESLRGLSEATPLGSDILPAVATDYNQAFSVSMNDAGDRVAIGSRLHNNYEGHVRVFEYNGSAWVQLGSDIDGVRHHNGVVQTQEGNSVSMNAAGDRVAIGGGLTGYARVFYYNGSAWVQLGSNIANVTDINGKVDLNAAGDRLAVSNISGYGQKGVTSVHEYNGSAWVQLGSDIIGEAFNEQSGQGVSMNANGSIVAIGARYAGMTGNNYLTGVGNVRVFYYNGSAWVQLGSSISGDNIGDRFGQIVSMNASGDIIAVSAPSFGGTQSNNNYRKGRVKIYKYSSNTWSQIGSNIDGEIGQSLGLLSLSINNAGDKIAIGGYNQTNNNVSVLVYQNENSTWNQKNSGDSFSINRNGSTFYHVSLNGSGQILTVGVADYPNNGFVKIFSLQAGEGIETFNLALDNGKDNIDVLINDTSVENTFSLSANKTSVNEGDSFTIALSTQGVLDDVLVPYTITGVTSAEISDTPLTGNFTISNNTDTKTFDVSADNITEGTDTFILSLDNGKDSQSVQIYDTSVSLEDQPLRILSIGGYDSYRHAHYFPLPPRIQTGISRTSAVAASKDILEGFSTLSYVYPPSYTLTGFTSDHIGPDRFTSGGRLANRYNGRPMTLQSPFNQNSDYFDSIIDPSRTFIRYSGYPKYAIETASSDTYDVLLFNHFQWTSHLMYYLRQQDDSGNSISPNGFNLLVRPPRIMQPDTATMDLLKAHVTNGGTIIEYTGYFNADNFEYPVDASRFHRNVIPSSTASFISQIIYDLGGITGSNSGWKGSKGDGPNPYPTIWALNNISSNMTNQLRGRSGTIINSRSNGQAVMANSPDESVVHLWDGKLGHLNSGVTGKIIFMGDQSLQGNNLTSSQDNYINGLSNPLLNYIARNR